VQSIAEYHDIERAQFEREIVPLGRPAVLRQLCAGWPAVRAAADGAGCAAPSTCRRAPFDSKHRASFCSQPNRSKAVHLGLAGVIEEIS
jgi:hypothetical protein